MKPPRIYRALNLVAGDLATTGLPKLRMNIDGNYRYRSIDDLLGCLAPILARRRVCVLPRVLERERAQIIGEDQSPQILVSIKVAFDLVSALDGSKHTVEAFGEALDSRDKATAKAMSAAFKSAMIQTFCIPITRMDADAVSPKIEKLQTVTEPPEGWPTWSEAIIAILESCETRQAGEHLLATHRSLFARLSRERPDLYATIGLAFDELTQRHSLSPAASAPTETPSADAKLSNSTQKEVANA